LRSKKDDANLDHARKLNPGDPGKSKHAPSKRETPVTHHVVKIHSALYSNMTPEEVRAEFARINCSTLRRC